MKRTIRKKIGYAAVFLCFAVGITVASFYDLAISSALSGFSEKGGALALSVPLYAKILEVLGEWPAVLLSSAAFLIVAAGFEEMHPKQALFVKCFSPFPVIALMAYGCDKTAEAVCDTLTTAHYAAILAISTALAALACLLIAKIPADAKRKLYLPAAYTLAAAAAILIIVSGIKIVWGRIRLRELVSMGSLDGFTPWYCPNFFSGSHSFPSGHTAHNTLLFMLPLWLYGKGEKHRRAFYGVIAAFVAAMAFSRLAAGAHYLSDVLFGFLIAFIITETAKFLCMRHTAHIRPK